MRENNPNSETETKNPKLNRGTFLKIAGLGGVVGGAVGGKVVDMMADHYRVENLTGSKEYEIEGSKVDISWVEAKPEGKEVIDPKRVVIYLGPWSWGAEMPIIKNIGQKIANGFGEKAFTISSRTDPIGPNALYIEAQGIAQFIQDSQIHTEPIQEVTIIGHSESGIKSPNLTVVLEQNYPQVAINGLVLLEPMGMYSRDFLELNKTWLTNMFKAGPEEFQKAQKSPPEGGIEQFLLSLWQDFRAFGLRYPVALVEELKTMGRLNPRLKDVKAPVIVIASDRDMVSNYRNFIPEAEVNKRAKDAISDEQLRSYVEQSHKWEHLPAEEQAKFASKEDFIRCYMEDYRKQEEMVRLGRARNKYLKENTFPKAENSGIIIGTKPAAHHTGLTDSRMEQAVRVISRIFPRLRRAA